MPKKYPPYQTCHRRFQQWVRSGQLNKAVRALARELHSHGLLPLEEGLLDGTFASCEKGGLAVGPTKRGKGTKIMAIAAVTSLPLAVTVESASPHETKLVEETLAGSFLPARLIGDRAYDSDPLDRRLERDYSIELIAPNRENRSQTQDGRKLRRYQRRWCVERLFAWLQWFRRLVTRYEYHIENFLGMVRLGCMRIMLRYL
jgi:transposase